MIIISTALLINNKFILLLIKALKQSRVTKNSKIPTRKPTPFRYTNTKYINRCIVLNVVLKIGKN